MPPVTKITPPRVLATLFALTALASVTGAQTASGDRTLRDVVRSFGLVVDSARLPGADTRITGYVTENASDLFAIAFFVGSPDSLHVATWDRAAEHWASATIDLRRLGVPDAMPGSLMAISHSAHNVLIDVHLNPSAGTIILLSRRLAPLATLPGWVLRVLPTGVVLYHHSSVHFAPTHWAELWTWDPVTRRDSRLYPNTPWDSVRRAYVDTVRAIYGRVGADWFRTHNHHMDPERFDSRVGDTVLVAPGGRTLAFAIEFGGGEGTLAETPLVEVIVVCRDVGKHQSRCIEEPLSNVLAKHPGGSTLDLLNHVIAQAGAGQSRR